MSSTAPPDLVLPTFLAEELRKKDESSEDFDETEVSFLLERTCDEFGELREDQQKACLAEVAALQLTLADEQSRSTWGTRYGPYVELKRRDGSQYIFPDIGKIDASVIRYWSTRAAGAKHPAFRSRYADVVWDLTKAVTGGKPSIEMARQAIDAYIECGTKFPNTETAESRLERALELALSVGDKLRAERVLATIFKLVDATEHPASRLLWTFDLWHRMRGVSLLPEQEKRLIDGIELELARICGAEKPVGIVAKEPALRLAHYYQTRDRQDDTKRVIRTYGNALAKFAETAQGFVAMAWYQEAYGIYLKYGLKEDAEAFQIAAKNKGQEAQGQMVCHKHTVEIPKKKMDVFLEEITAGSLEETVTRIAFNLFPKLDDVAEQLQETQQHGVLLSKIGVAKMGENQVVARAGSVDEDREGRMMLQMADDLKYTAIFLEKALDKMRERHAFTPKTLLPLLFQSPLFDPARTLLLEQGLAAYLADDHVKAIHVLMPQIEHCLRILLALLGKPTNKHRRSDLGVMIEKSLNDVLETEPAVQQTLGDDAMFYLRVLLCDPRGFNVRNDLAHGLMAPGRFDRLLSDRLIHVLFLLAQVRGKPASS